MRLTRGNAFSRQIGPDYPLPPTVSPHQPPRLYLNLKHKQKSNIYIN